MRFFFFVEKLSRSDADISISFRAHAQTVLPPPHGNHRLQIFLTTRDDRPLTTKTARHSLELDPNVVIGGISYFGVRM